MKTYTRNQIDAAMDRLMSVTPDRDITIKDDRYIQYNSNSDDFKMLVRLSDGCFFGYEPDTKEFVPPYGAIQSIKGM